MDNHSDLGAEKCLIFSLPPFPFHGRNKCEPGNQMSAGQDRGDTVLFSVLTALAQIARLQKLTAETGM